MITCSVPEIEGGYPERDREGGEGEGLVLENSRSWMKVKFTWRWWWSFIDCEYFVLIY